MHARNEQLARRSRRNHRPFEPCRSLAGRAHLAKKEPIFGSSEGERMGFFKWEVVIRVVSLRFSEPLYLHLSSSKPYA